MTDGLLVVDKPRGITSHDVVAAARRALGETRIGHTGTLDPLATGVLPLVCGRAARLAQFLAGSDKDYDAEIRIGLATDTYDVTGREVARSTDRPAAPAMAAALAALGGTYEQTPPPYSAKKIAGRRAYDLARRDQAVQPPPVEVTVSRVELLSMTDDVATVRLTCSAGFYVRSLAHDLGVRLGTGACLQALRRTRSGEFTLAEAVTLDRLLSDPAEARRALIPLERLLPGFPAAVLTPEGVTWVRHGRAVGPAQLSTGPEAGGAWVRLLTPDGSLAALARVGNAPATLHPSVVLI